MPSGVLGEAMSDISTAAIPRRDESIEVLGVPLEISFTLGAMSVNEWNHFKTLFETGEITPELAVDQLTAMDFKWNAEKNGGPIETTKDSLLDNVPQSFLIQTLYEVLNTFAPKAETSSTSVPGSKPMATGEKSRKSRRSASSRSN